MENLKNKGGVFKKRYHSQGGEKFIVKGSGQLIETEKDEFLIPAEAMKQKTIKKIHGTNKEVIDKINKSVGAKGVNEEATEVAVGDAIICRNSAYDKKKRTYMGTDKQIVSAVNESNGCKAIEGGAKVVEPDGKVAQYKKGGDVSTINARWDKKKKRIEELANNIHRLRLNVTRSLKSENEKEFLTALIISLMMRTSERIGNDSSDDNGHHGISNFRKKHIKVVGSEVTLGYMGKSGVEHEKIFTDKVLAEHLKKALKNSPSKYVFCTSDGQRVKSERVNRYLSDFNVTSKDIRGYNANNLITQKLKKIEIPDTEKERKKNFIKVAKSVAENIGHGLPTLRKHYMMPEVQDNYIFDAEIVNVKEASVFATGGELGAESMQKRAERRVDETTKKISAKDLAEIVGREPNYPYEYVGDLKFEKCFLINFYRLVK